MKDIFRKRSLSLSIFDGCCYSFMVGFGETYFAAYLLSKGYSEVAAGLISTIPLLAGGVLQLYAPQALAQLKSYKKLVTHTAAIQGLSLFMLALTAFVDVPIELIFIIIGIYWAGGMSTGPSWNSWMSSIVPDEMKVSFFAKRSMLSTLCIFLGILIGGVVLHLNEGPNLLKTFFFLFMGAGFLRLLSTFFLYLQIEPKHISEQIPKTSFKMKINKNYWGIFKFIFIFQFSVHIASGFFNPFMLKELKLNFQNYMILMALMFLTKVASQPFTQKAIERIGFQRTLLIATLGIVPLPLIWTLTDNFLILALGQMFSGLVWGMYELTIFLLLYNKIPVADRPLTLSQLNLYQTLSIIGGSIIGGLIFKNLETNYWGYLVIFYTSTCIRFCSIAFFPEINLRHYKLKDWFLLKPLGDRLVRGDFSQQPISTSENSKKAS